MISLEAVDPALFSIQDPHTCAPPVVVYVCCSMKTTNPI